MALRQVAVIGADGEIQGLQSGDTITATTNAPSVRSVTNAESSAALTIGMPVYASAADTVKRAQANAKTTSILAGVCYDATIAAGASGNIAMSGVIVATTTQWDAIAGTTGGLSFGSNYYLDPSNVGKITATPPSTQNAGQCITRVGRALSTTELELFISNPVLI